jgi:hypothetical protein
MFLLMLEYLTIVFNYDPEGGAGEALEVHFQHFKADFS